MPKQIGFDNEKYLQEQTAAILERVNLFHNKLYLEFGGKLLYDMHASRVLPGFDPNVKMRLLQQLKDKTDVLLCIYAGDIERKKIRADFGITYDADALKLIDDLGAWGITLRAVVITRFANQSAAKAFKNKLERRGIRVYTHSFTKGYPTEIDTIVSDQGYGANEYIETAKPIVVVTGPGPGSGKLATCLSQLYHDHRRGVRSGYAKFETFPIWNLPLNHPVNIAYEAATADLKDINLIDHYHLEAHDVKAVNYNRDIEAFPLVRRILEKITENPLVYHSPTDMGVNRAGFGILQRPGRARGGHPGDHPPLFSLPVRIRHGRGGQGHGGAPAPVHGGPGRERGEPQRGSPRAQGRLGGAAGWKRPCRHLLRSGHRAPGRHHHHRQELAAAARRLQPDPERRQAPGRHPRQHAPDAAQHHRIAGPPEKGYPERRGMSV